MNFNEVIAELPSLTLAERQQLVLRALELDDAEIPVEAKRRHHHGGPRALPKRDTANLQPCLNATC